MVADPKISIITPTLNAENNIEACILSVANQSYQNKEHLIIDGLSTDNTLAIVEKYAQQYPHIRFISEKDSGIYDAMNKGIDLASGEWVYFLGSDDLFHTDSVLEEIFGIEGISLYDLVYGNVVWGDTGTLYDGKFSLLKLMDKNICHQAIFYNSSVFRLLGKFDTKYKIWSDWLFNIKCFACEEIRTKYVDTAVAKFTFGGQSSQRIVDDTFLTDKLTIFKKYIPMEYVNANNEIINIKKQLIDRDNEIETLHSELKEKDKIIQAIINSLSWKITAPVRKLFNLLH